MSLKVDRPFYLVNSQIILEELRSAFPAESSLSLGKAAKEIHGIFGSTEGLPLLKEILKTKQIPL